MAQIIDFPLWQYTVAMPQPHNHLFEVDLAIAAWSSNQLNLKMPVWSPGSYLVREYARHLQNFQAKDGSGNLLSWQKIAKNQWEIQTQGIEKIHINYQIYANELTVRTNHLDASHGYFNGGAMFMYADDFRDHPFAVKILLPDPDWQIATALPNLSDSSALFFAKDFDTLVDSPFEIGIHQRHEFSVLGKPHAWVIWGEAGNLEIESLIRDTIALVKTEAQIFGGLPYDRYLFILHLSANGYGGLEHRDCCCLIYPRLGFRKESYGKFLNLVAHEFFHTWNVKRLRPQEFIRFNYDQENYTEALWFCEGATSYYDQLIPLRAGLSDRSHFYQQLSESITKLQVTNGRQMQSLAESSFDTWIKLYRPDPNSPNSQISYYLKGELVSLLLDLLVRAKTDSQSSLDRVMQILWQDYGQLEQGFSHDQLLQVIESVAGCDLTAFWQSYLYGTKELDYNFYFAPFGLTVQAVESSVKNFYTGMSFGSVNGMATVKFVAANSPAQLAGINVGDEILAINGIRVSMEQFGDRLQMYEYGEKVALTIFQQDLLRTVEIELLPPVGDRYVLSEVVNPTLSQKQNLAAWLDVKV